jgi:hypothetical protein
MADAMQELDSSIALAMRAIEDLKKKDPGHELLQWGETPFYMGPIPQSFMERFGGEHVSEGNRGTTFEMAEVYFNYYNAMMGVLGKAN